MDFLKGRKTYLAALGLALLGLVDFSNGDQTTAMAKWAQALGLLGIRRAIANQTPGGATA